jgi:MFS family permease
MRWWVVVVVMGSLWAGNVLKPLCRVAAQGTSANMTHPSDSKPTEAPAHARLHPDILKLGLVSFLTDLSSEMVFSVFAIFFTTVAGASASLLGLIEGLADFSASSLNYLAGWLSDRGGKRKIFAIAGYGFSTMAKTILLVSSSVVGLSLFRVIERLGKGFRGPPRDAWLSAIAPQKTRGYAFGVHKALDKAGAVLGPLVAYALLTWLGETPEGYRVLFWVAFVPAVLAVVVLGFIQDKPGVAHARESVSDNWKLLSPGFKRFLLPAGIFALGYFSLGFLLLKAHATGFSASQIVLLYALFNATCVVVAPLAGKMGDAVGRSRVVLLGYALYGSVSLGLVFASSRWEIIGAFAFYGLFYAIEDSQSKALIADLEHDRRATAMGVYNFVTGLLYLPASLMAGALWTVAPELAFGLASLLSLIAMGAFMVLRPAGVTPR